MGFWGALVELNLTVLLELVEAKDWRPGLRVGTLGTLNPELIGFRVKGLGLNPNVQAFWPRESRKGDDTGILGLGLRNCLLHNSPL